MLCHASCRRDLNLPQRRAARKIGIPVAPVLFRELQGEPQRLCVPGGEIADLSKQRIWPRDGQEPIEGPIGWLWKSPEISSFTTSYAARDSGDRFIKRRIAASLWFRSVVGALNTIEGYEPMHMIRKGQMRWLTKGDVAGQLRFMHQVYGIAA